MPAAADIAPKPPPVRAPRPPVEELLVGFVLGAALAYVFVLALSVIAANDLGWQLKTGEIIRREGRVPMTDRFSWSAAGERWIVHEWLTNVALSFLYDSGGPLALVLYKAVAAVAVAILLFVRCCHRTGRLWPALGATILAAATLRPYSDVRPQMMTFVCLATMMLALDRYRAGEWRWVPCGSPIFFLLWANLHGGVAIGLGVLGLWLLGESAAAAIFRRDGRWLAPLWLAAAASGLAGLVNPNGFDLYRYPFLVLMHPRVQDFILEWNSPNFHYAYTRPLQVTIALSVVGAGLARERRLGDLLVATAAIYASLMGMRHMALVAILATPLIADGASEWLRQLEAHPRLGPAPVPLRIAWSAAALALLLIGAWWAYPRAAGDRRPLPPGEWFDHCTAMDRFPRAAATLLAQLPSGSRLYNDYAWGGYLIWRLYPRWRVFTDGRAEVYYRPQRTPSGTIASPYDAQEEIHYGRNLHRHLEEWQIDTVVTMAGSPLARALAVDSRWEVLSPPGDVAFVARRVVP